VGALAAYGGVLSDALVRAGSIRSLLALLAGVGVLLLVVALVFGRWGLGPALWLGAGIYIAVVVHSEHGVDGTAPLMAVLLLLCCELSAWSLDERWRIHSDPWLGWRRAAAVAALALGGLAVSALVVALSAVPANHGLLFTVAGALAAVGAAGTGIWAARR
jgi:hypothetical protein